MKSQSLWNTAIRNFNKSASTEQQDIQEECDELLGPHAAQAADVGCDDGVAAVD